jgi:hypothetical protein
MCLTAYILISCITSHRYLVSVYRASTGNVHRSVGPDFVLSVGDILYFTGMVKAFGKFCAEHGLEVVTSENDATAHTREKGRADQRSTGDEFDESPIPVPADNAANVETESDPTPTVESGPNGMIIGDDVMQTAKRRLSILGPEIDKLQAINKMTGKHISRPLFHCGQM